MTVMRYWMVRIAVVAAAILTVGISFAEEAVLYWMVDDNAMVEKDDGETVSISSYFQIKPATEDSFYAARVRVSGGEEDVFLPLYTIDGTIDGYFGVEFGDNGSGYWGAGVPSGNQSPLASYGSPEYSFIVELGNISLGGAEPSWFTVAASDAASYSDITRFIHFSFDVNPGTMAVWTPTSFVSVPEPSSGLLLLIGGGLLMLRRRRKDGV